jgi:hypothetical protein
MIRIIAYVTKALHEKIVNEILQWNVPIIKLFDKIDREIWIDVDSDYALQIFEKLQKIDGIYSVKMIIDKDANLINVWNLKEKNDKPNQKSNRISNNIG